MCVVVVVAAVGGVGVVVVVGGVAVEAEEVAAVVEVGFVCGFCAARGWEGEGGGITRVFAEPAGGEGVARGAGG